MRRSRLPRDSTDARVSTAGIPTPAAREAFAGLMMETGTGRRTRRQGSRQPARTAERSSFADSGPGRQPERACRSEEHTSELQSLMRISYAVFCLKKKTHTDINDRLTEAQNKDTT